MQVDPPTETTPPEGSAADRAADVVLRGLIGGLLRVPYDRRVPLMGAAMRRLVGPVAGYTRRAEANLARVWPEMPEAERRALAQASLDNAGRTLIENYSWREFGARLSEVAPEGPGVAALERAVAEGRPVLFVTGHFGNHEAPRQVLTRLGHEIGGLYRPARNAYFNAHYERTMTDWGGPVFAQGKRGTLGFVKHLKRGGFGTLLFDVRAKGPALDFLGHPAHTALSAAEIATRVGAVVIPYFGIRQPDGLSFRVVLEEPIAQDAPRAMMEEMTRRLEAQIRANPAQWFWVHRRWKRRGDG